MNNPKYIIVHHTGGSDLNPLQDSSNFTFSECNELHRVKFNMLSSLGFYIGYHYYISKDGTVTQGRADTDEGAHTVGKNLESIGICLAGNFDATSPTEQQTNSLKNLLKQKVAQYNINILNVVPHRTFAVKTCYGNKLSNDWARNLLSIPTSLSKEQKLAKASSLLLEAMELLKGL